jgi:hypothetical protein
MIEAIHQVVATDDGEVLMLRYLEVFGIPHRSRSIVVCTKFTRWNRCRPRGACRLRPVL